MSYRKICQCCSMPINNPALYGTKADGTASKEYCIYCYKDGAFTKPNITLDEMKLLVKEKMNSMKMSDNLIKRTMRTLPNLKRWKYEAAIF